MSNITKTLILISALICGARNRTEEPDDSSVKNLSPVPLSWDLLFTSNRDGNNEIYLLKTGQTEWTNLTNHPASDNWPEWSPDGSQIAFQSNRNGNLDIWVMNSDGSNLTPLTDDPKHDYLPAWSPDGLEIIFTSWRNEPGDREHENHVYLMNADGSDQRRLIAESPGLSAGAVF
jgi:TolB protein